MFTLTSFINLVLVAKEGATKWTKRQLLQVKTIFFVSCELLFCILKDTSVKVH